MALGDGEPTVYSNELVARAAYAAGIIDGEGYIGIKSSDRVHVQRSRSHRIYISVCSIDEGFVDFLNINFGGSVDYKESRAVNRKPVYTWKTSAKNAADFLRFILPYLIVKRNQALTALELQDTISDSNKAKGVPDEVLLYRDSLGQKVKDLNKRRL